jgi:hypothetical protein
MLDQVRVTQQAKPRRFRRPRKLIAALTGDRLRQVLDTHAYLWRWLDALSQVVLTHLPQFLLADIGTEMDHTNIHIVAYSIQCFSAPSLSQATGAKPAILRRTQRPHPHPLLHPHPHPHPHPLRCAWMGCTRWASCWRRPPATCRSARAWCCRRCSCSSSPPPSPHTSCARPRRECSGALETHLLT